MPLFKIVLITLALYSHKSVEGIVGYNCGGGMVNRTTLSLMDIEPCNPDLEKPKFKKAIVALTQVANIGVIRLMRCYGKADHQITRCGHTIDTKYGEGTYTEFLGLSRSQCEDLNVRNTFISPHSGARFEKSPVQTHLEFSMVTSGSVTPDGSCSPGSPLRANGAYFDRPLRMTKYTITGGYINGHIDYDEKKIILPNGVRCDYNKEYCDSGDLGVVYWRVATPKCDMEGKPQEIVFKGLATLVDYKKESGNTHYVLVNHSSSLFQISYNPEKGQDVCGFMSHATEHPRLFLTILDNDHGAFPPLDRVTAPNIDISLYSNSKLMYVTRNIMGQVENLLSEFRDSRCLNDIKSAMSWLTMAMVSPRDFAYQYMGEPGYTAVTTGEVVHIAKCMPVEVSPLPSKGRCYEELPVSWNGTEWFLTPRSRILTRVGTEIQCTPGMLPSFKILGSWFTPGEHGLIEQRKPIMVSVDTPISRFEPMVGLAEGGIYSSSSLEKIQKMFLSPMEQDAIITRVSSGLSGDAQLPEGYSAVNLLSPQDYTNIGKNSSLLYSSWSWFSWATGPVFVISLLFKIFKGIFDWLVNSRVLFRDYGIWTALTFGCFPSLSHYMVSDRIKVPYFNKRSNGGKDKEMEEGGHAPDEVLVMEELTPQGPIYSRKSNIYPKF